LPQLFSIRVPRTRSRAKWISLEKGFDRLTDASVIHGYWNTCIKIKDPEANESFFEVRGGVRSAFKRAGTWSESLNIWKRYHAADGVLIEWGAS
jgi:hypothetical protein